MYERFTDRARKAMKAEKQDEAPPPLPCNDGGMGFTLKLDDQPSGEPAPEKKTETWRDRPPLL